MSEVCRFWLEQGVNVVIAAGTIGAVVVALFGERIKARLFRPRLELGVPKPEGVSTDVLITHTNAAGEQVSRKEKGRYFHVHVRNEARWPPATQAQICLIRVEEPGPDGEFTIRWTGDMPIRWMHQEIFPVTRTVGREAVADLCAIVKDKWLELFPMLGIMNLMSRRNKDDPLAVLDFVITLQARSAEGSSPPLRIRMSWNGRWEDGDVEMQRHFTLKVLPTA